MGTVDGELGPVLGLAPRRSAWSFELDRGLAVGFVFTERLIDSPVDPLHPSNRKQRKAVYVADLEANTGVQ